MKSIFRIAAIVLVCALAALSADDKPAETRAIDVQKSRLIVKAYKTGLFSGFAHDHEIEAPLTAGSVDLKDRKVALEFDAEKMKVLDPKESADKRDEIQKTMLSDKVLDVTRFPKIKFASRVVAQRSETEFQVDGDLTLHGVTKGIRFPVEVKNGVFTGKVPVTQTEFGIKPVSVAGGAVKVKDVVDVEFELKLK